MTGTWRPPKDINSFPRDSKHRILQSGCSHKYSRGEPHTIKLAWTRKQVISEDISHLQKKQQWQRIIKKKNSLPRTIIRKAAAMIYDFALATRNYIFLLFTNPSMTRLADAHSRGINDTPRSRKAFVTSLNRHTTSTQSARGWTICRGARSHDFTSPPD